MVLEMLHGLNLIQPFVYQEDDIEKPNFLFYSDISEKMKTLAQRFEKSDRDIIDLSNGNEEVTVAVKLDLLILRNRNLKTSDLIRDNLVYMAKCDKLKDELPGEMQNRSSCTINNAKIFQYRPMSGEVFVVNLVLKILDFVVYRDLDEIHIDFLKDENYGILVLSDEQMIEQIALYMKRQFKSSLNSFSAQRDPYGHPCDPHKRGVLILERVPVIPEEKFEESFIREHDTTINDKSIIYDEGDEYNSLEDLLLLKSNDTSKSTEDEEEETNFESILKSNNKPKKKQCAYGAGIKDNGFIKDINNMRHNETIVDIDEIDTTDDEKMDNNDNNILLSDAMECEQIEQFQYTSESLSIPVDLLSDFDQGIESPIINKQISTSSSFASPSKRRSISTKTSVASFSMIDKGEYKDLDYAFRDKSSSVPNYIKEDKKFKFIKVGKVQKFVSLFEEHLTQPLGESSPAGPASRLRSNSVSRQN